MPTAKKSTPKKSTARKSINKKSIAKKPAAKKPAAKKPAAKKPAAKKPAAKKPAAKKPAAKKPAAKKLPPKNATVRKVGDSPDEASVTYTLSELGARHGSATPAEIFARVTRDREALVQDGADVATARIATDCARLYGRAGDFYATATGVQKQALRGFDGNLLRIAIFAALQGQDLAESRRRNEASGADVQAQRQDAAQMLRQGAVARRDQLASLLRLAAGGDAVLDAEIGRKFGRIATPELVAQALSELAALGRTYLKSRDSGLKQRAGLAGLDADYLAETDALAKRVMSELKAGAASRPLSPVAQAEVDLWDGINLFLLGRIIELFEVAHAVEPTVPRLLPLSLRNWFGRSSKAPASPPPPPTSASPA